MMIAAAYVLIFSAYVLIREFNGEEAAKKKIFLFVALSLLFVLTGFRAVNVGSDTASYVVMFRRISASPLFHSGVKSSYYGFNLYFYLLTHISGNMTFLLLCSALPVYAGLYILFREFQANLYEAFKAVLIMLVLGFFAFCLSGISQGLAMGFVFISYVFVRRRKPWKFILLVLLAASFHLSALVFLIAYPVSRLRVRYTRFTLLAAVVAFTVLAPQTIKHYIILLMGERFYAGYFTNYASSNNYTGLLIQLCFYFPCFYRYKRMENGTQKKDYEMLLNIAFFGLLFQSMTSILGEFFRISMYFSIGNCLMFPKWENQIGNDKTRLLVRLLTTSACYTYLFVFQSAVIQGYFTVF